MHVSSRGSSRVVLAAAAAVGVQWSSSPAAAPPSLARGPGCRWPRRHSGTTDLQVMTTVRAQTLLLRPSAAGSRLPTRGEQAQTLLPTRGERGLQPATPMLLPRVPPPPRPSSGGCLEG